MPKSNERAALLESPDLDVDALLTRVRNGDASAKAPLISASHSQLRLLASYAMKGQRANHTLRATSLVSEVCLKILESKATWKTHAHFLAYAGTIMRHHLVDHARRKGREGVRVVIDDMDTLVDAFDERCGSLVALDDALARLAVVMPSGAMVVEMRFFGGASMAECSEFMDVPKRTTERIIRRARGWLRLELGEWYPSQIDLED